MKKLFCILLTVALVAAFAFMLVACDNNKTETFTMTENDLVTLRDALSATSNEAYFTNNTRIENAITATDCVTVCAPSAASSSGDDTVSVTTTVTSKADGGVTVEYKVRGMAGTSLVYNYAFYEDDTRTEISTQFNTSIAPVPAKSTVLGSAYTSARDKLQNVIKSGSYYDINFGECTRKGDTTTYNLDYDDESTSGTITVVVTGGKIVKIVVADDSGETTTTNYTFGAEAANAYTADEWQTLHPEQL